MMFLAVVEREKPHHQPCLLIRDEQGEKILLSLERFQRTFTGITSLADNLKIGLNVSQDMRLGFDLKAITAKGPPYFCQQ